MTKLYYNIQTLEKSLFLSKHECLVNGIIDSIDAKVLGQGDILPSVNNMVNELGYARKTIVKAYDELKERGIVESKKRLGYFIASEATQQKLKVAILLYAFQTFQEDFYNILRKKLGKDIQLDVFFHHQNPSVYKSILQDIKAKYGMLVVAPIQDPELKMVFKEISSTKILFIDRYFSLGPDYSFIAQEFKESFYKALCELEPTLQRFEELVLLFKEKSDYPKGIKVAFDKFCKEKNLNSRVQPEYVDHSIKKGRVYFTIGDTDLWKILRDCKRNGLKIGTDVGILSQNDSPAKELIGGGISTFSTNFIAMAEETASYVLNRNPIQKIIPSKLIRRDSL